MPGYRYFPWEGDSVLPGRGSIKGGARPLWDGETRSTDLPAHKSGEDVRQDG